MTSFPSVHHETRPIKTVAVQADLFDLPTYGPGGMGAIRGQILCEPAGFFDLQNLYVQIDSKRVKAECGIDDQGRFVIDNLPPGRYCIYVREALTRYQILCPGVQVRIDTGQPEHEVALQVGKPATVTILAQRQGTGQLISGLSIQVQSASGPAQTASTTDSVGQCEFELAPGQYLVETPVFINDQSIPIGPQPLTVASDGRAIQFVLSIPARPPKVIDTLECLLVDSTGSSMPGFVRISGLYRIDDTEPNTHFVIPILWDVYPGEWSIGQAYDNSGILARRFLYKRETRSLQEIVLEQRATITGRVVDPNGQAIPDTYLDLDTVLPDGSVRGGDDSFYRLSLADDGGFVFTEVAVGLPVKVVAGATGRSQGRSRVLDLKSGKTTDVGDIVLIARRPQNGVITGWVTDGNNSPFLKCPILGHGTLTNEEGRFTLERLPKDEDIRIMIDLPGYGQWSKTTRADDLSFNLQVFPEGWQVIGNQALPLLAAQWWNNQSVSLEQVQGKVVVLALGADPFADDRSFHGPTDYARPLMDIHRRFGGTRVQVVILMDQTYQSYYPIHRVRQDLEDAYLEPNDPTFAACVDEDPKLVAQLQPEGSRSRGATYTLYQARRPNTVVLIDKRGIVRAYPSNQDLFDWVQRLQEE